MDTENCPVTIPYSFASANGVFFDGSDLLVHRPGLRLSTLLEIRSQTNAPFKLKEISEEEFNREITHHYQGNGENEARQVAEDIGTDSDLIHLADQIPDSGELMDGNNDAPVIRLINAIFSQAVRNKASDIHIEPYEDRLSIRFRVDGVLSEVLSPKLVLAPLLASRIKVLAKLDIAEKRLPQDGRFSVRLAGHPVDFRISTIPSAHGERVVLRLLDKQAGRMTLDQLSMPDTMLDRFKNLLHKPHGIILITGPTGSGKTTSLYAGLSHLNETSRNILTIEDPIEYLIPGIGQTQVNPKIDMTFARGLRAILRQDPDIVMIGEIRDAETASIAVQASLTGHLVLSTLHTNTAIGAITRLRDMGIEPFLLSSSILAVMAQRLVRLLCQHCKEPFKPDSDLRHRLNLPEEATLFRPSGCPHCNHSGYQGRSSIFELIDIDDTLAQAINKDQDEAQLLSYARQKSRSISDAARDKIINGETSLEEVMRVTAVG